MKLLFIYLVLTIVFLVIGTQAFRHVVSDVAASDGGIDKKDVQIQTSESGARHQLACVYCLIKQSFSPVKQVDVADDGSGWIHRPYKIFRSYCCLEDILLSGPDSGRKFIRLLSERHADGFYIYSFGKLIV